MSDKLKSKFEELNLTKDELQRLNEAMKKEEFRKLLVEYAEEISDPKNRELYEREITQLERERGMNVIFINPEAGYCMKTTENGNRKCFINICKNSNIEKPTSSVEKRKGLNDGTNSRSGLFWHIPHTCSPPKEDVDKSGKEKCTVYDVVFHPDAYRMGETNKRFNDLLKDTAVDSIEKNFNVKLDRVNLKVLKHMNFKGRPTASVIRRPDPNNVNKTQNSNDHSNTQDSQIDPVESLVDQLKKQYYEDQLKKTESSNSAKTIEKENKPNVVKDEKNNEYTVPEYKLIHRGEADIQNYTNQVDHRLINSTRPKELVVRIDLPLCKSSELLSLDIFEKQLLLKSNDPNYLLDLKLPYPINEKESRAKFDKSKKCLNVTLPVLPFVFESLNLAKDENQHFTEKENEDVNEPTNDCSSSSSFSDAALSQSSLEQIDLNDLKFKLPSQIEIIELKDLLRIKCKISNYDNESIDFKIINDHILSLKCSSTSSGGYTTFYSSFFTFLTDDDNKKLAFSPCIDIQNSFKLEHLDEDNFTIQINKLLNHNSSKALISVEKINVLDKIDLQKSILVNFQKQLNNESFDDENQKISTNSNIKKQNTKNLNELSKKEFIFNFQSMASKSSGSDDDEDDDLSSNDLIQVCNEKENLLSKAASKNIEATRFRQQKKLQSTSLDLEEKIEEESEEEQGGDEENECEKNYLSKSLNENHDMQNECENSSNSNNNNNNLYSSYSTNEDSLASSLNGSTYGRLKGILKKPRSYSESESSLMNTDSNNKNNDGSRMSISGNDSSSASDENSDLHGSKKSVSFSNQVVKNVFKPGSTVNGMKKPNANKNKKKNKRKRTSSDPSHDSNSCDLKDAASQYLLRSRSISESSDDNGVFVDSNENIQDSLVNNDTNIESKTATIDNESKDKEKAAETVSKKKKNKKKSKNNNNQNSNKEHSSNHFDMETMLEWKNQEKLSDKLELNSKINSIPNSLNFKNKIVNDLDD